VCVSHVLFSWSESAFFSEYTDTHKERERERERIGFLPQPAAAVTREREREKETKLTMEREDEGTRNKNDFADDVVFVSSRLCVKNLPKHYTEARFRDHFAPLGEVTDCVIKTAHDTSGSAQQRQQNRHSRASSSSGSRCLGFIGYKTEDMAAKALKYFHNTFIDTSRIDVSFALSRKDREKASLRGAERPWSKYSEGTSANERMKKEEERKNNKKNGKDDEGEDGKKEDPNRFIGVRERIKMEKAALRAKKEQFISPEEKMLEEKLREDPKLREYMALMLPKSKFAAKFWSDGLVHEDEYASGLAQTKITDGDGVDGKEKIIEDTEGGNANEDSDDDEYQDLDNDSSDSSSSDDESEEEIDSDSDDIKKDETVSDMDYLKAKKGNFSDSDDSDDDDSDSEDDSESSSDDGEGKEVDDDDDDDDSGSDTPSDDDEDAEKKKSKKSKNKKKKEIEGEKEDEEGEKDAKKEVEVVQATDMESLQETGRVFLRNLAYTCTEEELFDHLQSHVGKLTAVHVLVDKSTKQSKGLAYATFALPEDGVKCIDVLDGAIFQGRILHVLPAKRAPTNAEKNTLGGVGRITLNDGEDNGEDNDDPNNNSYKKQKEQMRKADAADKKAWNALFMRQDTVLSAVAAIYGVDKSDLLSTETEDVAVRVALGEAQVIANTKKELGNNGVNVQSLESGAESRKNVKIARSKHSILIKNLPYETEESDLREMCEKFGSLSQLVLPSTRTIAIAEFLESNEARRAFQGLAYKRYKHVPLYVEWAPKDIFNKKSADADDDDNDDDGAPRNERTAKTNTANKNASDYDDEDEEKSKVLFVKNIDFATTDESFLQFFENLCKRAGGKNRRIVSAKIARKPSSDGKTSLSKGFGFVEFESHETASICSKIVSTGAGKLDGKVLSTELSKQKMSSSQQQQPETVDDDNALMKKKSKIPKGKSATKLVLRNVAFEATKRDIQKLFNPFGTLKSVRVPKKFDGSHRGFAFIEYTTQREATDAMEALGSAHLYGRKCVIERADEDESAMMDGGKDSSNMVFGESNVEKLREKAKRQVDGGLKRSVKRQRA
jgi:multiple RNA-binding domain-containing protein 1